MMRRALLSALCSVIPVSQSLGAPKMGDAVWVRRFGAFLRELNEFVFALNEDRLDRARWARVRAAWKELEDN